MLHDLIHHAVIFWDSIFNAESWEAATAILAVVTTFVVSCFFAVLMLGYPKKRFLDWAIFFRETAWIAVAFRFGAAMVFEWPVWAYTVWLVWGYVAVATTIAFIAALAERRGHRARPRGEAA